MQRVFGVFVHPDPPGLAGRFRDIGRVDLAVRQYRETFQTLALRSGDPAIFDLLYGAGHDFTGLIRFLHTTSSPLLVAEIVAP